jgi:hypothetical protein
MWTQVKEQVKNAQVGFERIEHLLVNGENLLLPVGWLIPVSEIIHAFSGILIKRL